jgi:hypothetical protein
MVPEYDYRGRSMKLEEWDLQVQIENPVDFDSLNFHRCSIRSYYEEQGLMDYFKMLNGPTYEALVRHFWVRAKFYNKAASLAEESQMVLMYPELEGKTREEMGLAPFVEDEIRSSICGIPVRLAQWHIEYVLKAAASGYYSGIDLSDAAEKRIWKKQANLVIYNSEKEKKYAELSMETKMLLKIQNENLFPSGDCVKPNLAQKVLLQHFIKKEKVNVPKYMFKYLVECLKQSQLLDKPLVPYGRLLSEIFYQGGILDSLSQSQGFTDQLLDTKTGKFINAHTLLNMKLISEVTKLQTDLSESFVKSDLMKDFPPICKKDPIEVQMYYIKEHFEATNERIRLEDIPEEMYGGALPRARGRKSKRKITAEQYLEVEQPAKKAKVATDKLKIGSSSVPSIEEAIEDMDSRLIMDVGISLDQPAIPKRKRKPALRRTKDFPHITSTAQDASDLELKELQEKKAAAEKVLEIAAELQESVVSEAKKMLQMTSEFAQEDSDPEPEKVINISSDSASKSLSDSDDSDDDIPLAQLFRKPVKSQSTSTKTNDKPSQSTTYEPVGHIINEKLAELAEQRERVIDTIFRLHPQPLNIQPLNMIPPENVESTSEKASEATPEAAASENVVSENPHQQTPEPHKPTTPPQSPTATIDPQLNTQTSSSPQQPPTETEFQPLPEHSPEPTPMDVDISLVNVQASTSTTHIASDQPSSSNTQTHFTIPVPNPVQDLEISDSDLEILEQPPSNILESGYINSELLSILSQLHNLVDQRRTIDLTSAYDDSWASLQNRATELIESIRAKCIRSKEASVRKLMEHLNQSLRVRSSTLLLANQPFFSETDYLTREARLCKLLKKQMAQQQQEAKEREQALLQRQQQLEELLQKKIEEMEEMKKQHQTNP